MPTVHRRPPLEPNKEEMDALALAAHARAAWPMADFFLLNGHFDLKRQHTTDNLMDSC